MNVQNLEQKCKEIRQLVMECIASRGKGHIGGSLSAVETLVVLYYDVMHIDPKNPAMEGRDQFVLSKGHAGPCLYAVLADKGYFDISHLKTLNRPETILPSHCDRNRTPGVDMTTGSLGQGFSCAVGLALGARMKGDHATIYSMIGDGEMQEGQIWEAIMLAGCQKLSNFVALVDWNKMQVDGMVEDINSIEPLTEKFQAFKWRVIRVPNGNDVAQVQNALRKIKAEPCAKPTALLLETVKGKGVTWVEEMGFRCHSIPITEEQRLNALEELR